MKNIIACCFFSLFSIFTCYSQLDSRVSKLEQLYWEQGAFLEMHTLAETLSTYMELAENPLNECVIDIYKSLAEIHLSLSNDETVNCLLNAEQALSGIVGPMSRYEGLALMAQSRYYTGTNSALAVKVGNKALEILEKACPDQIELVLAKSIVGYAYLFNGDGVKSEQLLTSAIELFKNINKQETWISSLSYAYRSAAYVALQNVEGAVKDVAVSIEFFNEKEFDEVLFPHMVLTNGMAVYVFTSCGFYDEAITISQNFLQTCEDLNMTHMIEYGCTLQNLGSAYILKKDNVKGLEYLEKAKAHFEKYGYTDTDSYQMLIRNLTYLKNN